MALTKVKAGNIILTTPSSSSNDTTPATTQYVTTAINDLIDTAPSTLNTLNELAAALGDDVNFSTTVTNSIATKLPLAGGTLTGTLTVAGSSSGTVDALIITNTDTTNNGLSIGVDSSENAFFWNGSNTSMNFATNNALKMVIDSSGRVGIGTDNPSTKLTIKNDSASTSFGDNNLITIQNLNTTDNARMGLAFTGNTGIGSGLAIIEGVSYDQSHGHTSLNFSVYNGSWHNDMMVLKAGNVGIGNDSPTSYGNSYNVLHVGDASTPGLIKLGTGASTDGPEFYSPTNNKLYINTSGNTNVLNLVSSNVGIGTVLPHAKLNVQGNSASTYAGNGPGATIQASQGGAGNWIASEHNGAFAYFGIDSNKGKFAAYNYATSTEMDMILGQNRMYIKNDGRVGINRTPSIANSKLEVGGADNVPLINVEASGATAGIGLGGGQLKIYTGSSHIGGFSIGATNKYNSGSSPGFGGNGGNLRLEGDDSQIIMANNIIHSDNSGNTKFIIRAAYGAVTDAAELQLDGGIITMNVGTSFTEMVKVALGEVQIGRTSSSSYYLKVLTSNGYGSQGSLNSSYYHHATDRGAFYWGTRCEASGGFHTYSDENLKKEITTIDGALDLVAKMNGVTFKWKDPEKRGGGDEGKQFGIIAQNMLEVDPELPSLNDDPLSPEETRETDDSFYTMDYTRLTPYFIEAIKELKAKNEALEARITELEG